MSLSLNLGSERMSRSSCNNLLPSSRCYDYRAWLECRRHHTLIIVDTWEYSTGLRQGLHPSAQRPLRLFFPFVRYGPPTSPRCQLVALAQHLFFGYYAIPSCPRQTFIKLFSDSTSPRLITAFRTRPRHSDWHFRPGKTSYCFFPIPLIATSLPSFPFASSPHLCLHQISSLRPTRKPDCFEAPPVFIPWR